MSKNTEKDSFYNFVNDKWLNSSDSDIPIGYNRWGTFNEIDKQNNDKLLELIGNITDEDVGGNKVKILFNQYLNRNDDLKDSMYMIKSFLDKIKMIDNKTDLLKFVWKNFTKYDISLPFTLSVDSDLDNSNLNILHISGGGLGLPDKDYYLDQKHKSVLLEYKSFMKNYLNLFGNYNWENIYSMEEKLAETMFTKIERRNAEYMNNKYDLEVIDKNFSKLFIKDLLKYLKLETQYKINIINPKFLKRFYEMWKGITIKNWIEYFSWVYLRYFGEILSKETNKIIFDFYSGTLNGVKEMKPERERALDFVSSRVGMILSKVYVQKYFPEEKRENVIELVNCIKNKFRERLLENTWMCDETKDKAIIKLDKMNFKIVSPNEGEWRNYDNLEILDSNSLIRNVLNIKKFEFDFELSQLNKELDRTLWFMNPHDVNAYYSPNYNEIVFPAGILQGDFFGDDMIKNFGGIGVVIGHEITHGFDDEGRKFDDEGNLNNWWNSNDIKKFECRANKLEKQFDKLTLEGLKLNGKLTLGENIADLGGVVIGYYALSDYMNNKGEFTDDHKMTFFKSFANIWKSNATPESNKLRVTTDPHSPPIYRVNEILKNFTPFIDLYNITNSDNMYLCENDRISIW